MATITHRLQRITATPTYLTVALGVALVGWQSIAGSIPWLVQSGAFAILLIGVGIPHGALDHLIERETAVRRGSPFSLGWFLTKYLLIMALYGVAWLVFPSLSLGLFLLISAWHFGETDIERVPPTLLWTITRFVAGGFVLAFILLTHTAEVTLVIERITHHHALTMDIWHWVVRHSSLVGLCWGVLTGCLFAWAFQSSPVATDWLRLVRLAIILALGCWLPLLLAFALYFGGWHALNSFQTIHGYLEQGHRSTLTAGQIWLKSLPFTAIALVSLVAFAWWWQHYAHQWDPLPLVFVFLSLITLPHLNVMHGMNRRIG